ncbi:MAG: HYR domain-containing protein, partial [Acidobacteria bacterium]|nr:HYR domain-containing protein [Acidobacteriota bacterium]
MCLLLVAGFMLAAEPRQAAGLLKKQRDLFTGNTTIGKVYNFLNSVNGVAVPKAAPVQGQNKPGGPHAPEPGPYPPAKNSLLNGTDDCPGTTISSLPFTDSGTTVGRNNTVQSIPVGCSNYATTGGPDVMYTFTVATAGSLTVTVTPTGGTGYDTSFYVINSCPAGTGNVVTSGCQFGQDSAFGNGVETDTIANLPAGTYYLFVDSFYNTGQSATLSQGTFNISVSGTAVLGGCTLTTSNIVVPNTTGQCSAVVNYPAPGTTGNCGTVTCSPASGIAYNVGTTTVSCTSSVGGGSTSFTVTVQDTEAPTIGTCPTNISVNGNGPTVVTYTPPTASDNCPGVSVNCSPASGSSFAVGTTTVTCTASDASPNSPNSTCAFTVTVTPCTITCPANVTAWTATTSAAVNYAAPTTTGSCGTVTCSPASGSSFAVGTTTVTCSTTAGPSCSFNVTVNQLTLAQSGMVNDPLRCIGPGDKSNLTFTLTNTSGASATVVGSVALTNV